MPGSGCRVKTPSRDCVELERNWTGPCPDVGGGPRIRVKLGVRFRLALGSHLPSARGCAHEPRS